MTRVNIGPGSFLVLLYALLCVIPQSLTAEDNRKSNPLTALSSSIRDVTRRVTPAVVEILVVGYSAYEDGGVKTSNDISRQRSSGSGVIVDATVM